MYKGNTITIDLDRRIACAQFASGVVYSLGAFPIAFPSAIKTPDNEKKVVFREIHLDEAGKPDVKREQVYTDLDEAKYDSSLPSAAKYLLQGLVGIPI